MATKNPRINVTFNETAVELLNELAKKENKSISMLAKELILEALEYREDLALSTLAKIRDKSDAKRITHEDAWK